MKTIVITGSTAGIGFGLAQAFAALGCRLVISGRSEETVREALGRLSAPYAIGIACDVRNPEQVERLWERAAAHFKTIDIWINNAGISGPLESSWDYASAQSAAIVETNLLGTIYGAQTAMRRMLGQGHGAIYNMLGMGSDGRMVDGLVHYGTTKRAIEYFTRGLVREAAKTPIIIGSLSPGMVATRLITDGYQGRDQDWQRVKPLFNIIADRVETVAPWLARSILENQTNGARIRWMSRPRLFGRFLLAPFRKRQVFDDPR